MMSKYSDVDWDDIEIDPRHDGRYLDNLYLQLKNMKAKPAIAWDVVTFLCEEGYENLSFDERKAASILDLEKSIEIHLISLAKVFIAGPTNTLAI